ncbi:HlyD family secretion protein [Ciceribacter azotifigens]|uniref:HlyD family secretion protein n=1 Tax=Ciceribacter azotifigens TaxID=2069303 RepID=UPI003A86A092
MENALTRLDPNLPDPVESRRRSAGRFVRFVYGTLVFGLLAALILYFGTPLVFLGSPGIVSAPRQLVSLPYAVQVVDRVAEPGEAVSVGDEIARVRSPQQDEIVATYMRGLSELAGREADLRIREQVAQNSLPAARAYLELTATAVNRLAAAKNAVSLTYELDVRNAHAQARKDVASQEAEAAEASVQIAALAALRERLQQQVDRLERDFANGRVVAPVSGIVSPRMATAGESLVAGTAIAEIYDTSDIFIDWFVPDYRLVEPKVGKPVFVLFGNRRISGEITRILPVSDVYEEERTLAGSRGRSAQVARIRMAPGSEPPALGSTVHVHMYYSGRIGHVAADLVHLLGLN